MKKKKWKGSPRIAVRMWGYFLSNAGDYFVMEDKAKKRKQSCGDKQVR
jgi:hypothetical protein